MLFFFRFVEFIVFYEFECRNNWFWLNLIICVEIVDRDGKSSLLSLVKAFDSVLAVYEGFCNLKQVGFLAHFKA